MEKVHKTRQVVMAVVFRRDRKRGEFGIIGRMRRQVLLSILSRAIARFRMEEDRILWCHGGLISGMQLKGVSQEARGQ